MTEGATNSGKFIPCCRVLIMVFTTLFVACSYTQQKEFKSSIPVSRLDLLHALFVHQTVQIDTYHENTPDKAVFKGKYYCDKAPGTVLLALPSFALAVGLLKVVGTPLDSDSGWLISSWIACAGSLALVTALGSLAMFIWLCQWVQPRYAYLTTLALCLGATPLPYSTLLMSHALTVGLLAISLWAGDCRVARTSADRSDLINAKDMLAGCCCGLALASEFSAGIAVGGVLLHFVVQQYRRAFSLMLGMLPALALVPAYNWVCFGSPFVFAYHHQAVFTQMHQGFFGINWPPDAEKAFGLIFGLRQGLFCWSPVLLLAFVGYSQLVRNSKELFLVTYLVPILQVAAISAYFLPEAGNTFGPRLLSPILPLMALPTALGIASFPRIGAILAGVSILLTTFATVIDIRLRSAGQNPLLDFYVPSFLQQKFSYNLGSVLGLPGYWSLLPLVLVVGAGIWFTWRNLSPVPKA